MTTSMGDDTPTASFAPRRRSEPRPSAAATAEPLFVYDRARALAGVRGRRHRRVVDHEPHANLRLIRTLATVTRSVAPRPADDTSTEDRTGAHIAAPPRHSPRLGLLLNRDGDRVRAPNVGW
jgi:hypothetical protein